MAGRLRKQYHIYATKPDVIGLTGIYISPAECWEIFREFPDRSLAKNSSFPDWNSKRCSRLGVMG
jgi:hypothetical protein